MSTQLPDTLFYYHEASRPPFESISELSSTDFADLMGVLAESNIEANRFDESWKRDFYLFFRPYTEQYFREKFIDKGGVPKLEAPRYLSLGPTGWFLDWYEDARVVEIPLAAIPGECISFTYPDSMTSLLIAEDRFEPFAKFKQPYHGELFRLEELAGLIAEYGMPDETDPVNLEYGNRIVEAQVWDLEPLMPFTERSQ